LIPILSATTSSTREVFPSKAIHSDNVAQGITCRMKVFLSHSTKDKQFVEALAAEAPVSS
jgi:hypothetical protein